MRILFCTNSLGAKGGIEKVTIVKANAFADIDGNQVAVCFTDKGTYPDETIHPVSPKLKIYDLEVPFWELSSLGLKNLLIDVPKKFWRLRQAIRRVILDFNPDIIITTGSYEKYALASLRPRALLKKPCAKIREYHFNSDYRRYITTKPPLASLAEAFEYRVLGRMFDMNYLLTKEDLDTHFKGRRGFAYQHNPLSFKAVGRIPISERDRALIMVCRLTHQKNVHAAIRAWAAISHDFPQWRLRIVGDGDQRAFLQSLADSLGIAQSVDFLGYQTDVVNPLCSSRILVMTSQFEGCALNMLEGMACGTVPVSYRTPCGPADIITDGVDGALVEYMDEAALARKLRELMQREAELERMSQAAVRRAADFSVSKISNDWMANYNSLLRNLQK